jgi:cell division transport system permease protein
MRAKYVLNEVLVGLWRNVTMTVAMIITMAVSLIMLGASVLMYMQVDRMKSYYYGEIEVAIFLNENATDAQRSGLDAALASNPLVQEKTYESKDQAYQKFQEMWKDSPSFVSAIKPGDLPDSYRVKLKNPEQYSAFQQSIQGLPGISDVVDQRQLLGKVFNIFNSLRLASLVFAAFMGVAALLLVGNTIQVAAYSKRREVAVMKLVGASNWFIQAPFVLEAVAAGLIGSVVGWIFLFVAKKVVVDGSLQDLTRVLTPVPDSNVLLQLPIMAGTGALVSAVTAWVTLRFYLRV